MHMKQEIERIISLTDPPTIPPLRWSRFPERGVHGPGEDRSFRSLQLVANAYLDGTCSEVDPDITLKATIAVAAWA